MIPSEHVHLVEKTLSHCVQEPILEEVVRTTKARILRRGDRSDMSSEEMCHLVDLMQMFELGRFLLKNRGLNAHWIHYIVVEAPKQIGEQYRLSDLERFFLYRAPTFLATQERYTIFQREIQKRLFPGCIFASLPCGVMADLIDLDYRSILPGKLVGIDLEYEALQEARRYAEQKGRADWIELRRADAWELNCCDEFDLLTSNGLNIYEPSDERVLQLFKQFYKALKPGGVLIASYLSLPPLPGFQTEWDLREVDSQDALMQKILLGEILQVKWQVYRSRQQMEAILRAAGFAEWEFFDDRARIFPVIVAKK
jgi:SAM-dependent methyltransferase